MDAWGEGRAGGGACIVLSRHAQKKCGACGGAKRPQYSRMAPSSVTPSYCAQCWRSHPRSACDAGAAGGTRRRVLQGDGQGRRKDRGAALNGSANGGYQRSSAGSTVKCRINGLVWDQRFNAGSTLRCIGGTCGVCSSDLSRATSAAPRATSASASCSTGAHSARPSGSTCPRGVRKFHMIVPTYDRSKGVRLHGADARKSGWWF
jgi:hypothetical protein